MRIPRTWNIVSGSATPHSAPSISVCPGYGEPACHSASLLRGAVAIAWARPWRAPAKARAMFLPAPGASGLERWRDR